MSQESMQDKVKRVRGPRVHISYKVETLGSPEVTELPFVVGVIADLSGKPREPLKKLKERKFVTIDRDSFNEVMKQVAPRATMKVANRLTDEDGNLSVDLTFNHIDDFEPARVAEQVPALKELLDLRRAFDQLLCKTDGNDGLLEKLEKILTEGADRDQVMKELGIEAANQASAS